MKEKMIETILPIITVSAVILIAVVIGSNLGNRDSPLGASTVQEVMKGEPIIMDPENKTDKRSKIS